jgi:hypothetical protein
MITPTPNLAWRTLWPMRQPARGGVACGAAQRRCAGPIRRCRRRCRARARRREPLHELARDLVEKRDATL